MRNMTTTMRFSRAIKLFNVKLPLKRNESFLSFVLLQWRWRVKSFRGWPLPSLDYLTILIKKRSHSARHNFHIKKQFYSLNFFDYSFSFLFDCSWTVRYSWTWEESVRGWVYWDKNVLIKAEIKKTEIKLILCWDFIIRFVITSYYFSGSEVKNRDDKEQDENLKFFRD